MDVHQPLLVGHTLQLSALRHAVVYFQLVLSHVGDNHEEEEHGEDEVRQG